MDNLFDLQQFRGLDATEKKFKNLDQTFSILHIASHAVIDNKAPLQSNILFYPQENAFEEDGQLKLWELYSMDIPARFGCVVSLSNGRWRGD